MGALSYDQRMRRDRLSRALNNRPTPTQADFDAKVFVLSYHYGDTGVRREITVLALDEEHAKRVGEIRNANQLIASTIHFDSARQMTWSAELLAVVLEFEHASECYDRQQEWQRRHDRRAPAKCEHGRPTNDSCEDCLLDAASDRMDAGQAVPPELVKAVNQRDWERRR